MQFTDTIPHCRGKAYIPKSIDTNRSNELPLCMNSWRYQSKSIRQYQCPESHIKTWYVKKCTLRSIWLPIVRPSTAWSRHGVISAIKWRFGPDCHFRPRRTVSASLSTRDIKSTAQSYHRIHSFMLQETCTPGICSPSHVPYFTWTWHFQFWSVVLAWVEYALKKNNIPFKIFERCAKSNLRTQGYRLRLSTHGVSA